HALSSSTSYNLPFILPAATQRGDNSCQDAQCSCYLPSPLLLSRGPYALLQTLFPPTTPYMDVSLVLYPSFSMRRHYRY
ncbi:hypothetical protein COCCADRAFT_101319, partial [Bipolaris zeicola 26-R-13]